MLRRILLTGLIAGTAAGLFAAGLQHLRLIPLIAAAEVYEAAGAHADHQHGRPESAPVEWQPAPGLERTGYTVLADVLAGIGFALLLAGGVALARLRGYAIDDEETYHGVRCIAAPIRNHSDSVIASLSLSSSTQRITPQNITVFADLVRETAAQISARLGHGEAVEATRPKREAAVVNL